MSDTAKSTLESLLQGKAVYICGPVTGVENYSEQFYAAARLCADAGARWTCNPCELVHADTPWSTAMAQCVGELAKLSHRKDGAVPFYDVLLTLPGASDSRGALLETVLADALGMKRVALTVDDLNRVHGMLTETEQLCKRGESV